MSNSSSALKLTSAKFYADVLVWTLQCKIYDIVYDLSIPSNAGYTLLAFRTGPILLSNIYSH